MEERPRGMIPLLLSCHATSRGREQKAGTEKSHFMDLTNLVGRGGRDSLRGNGAGGILAEHSLRIYTIVENVKTHKNSE